MDARAEKRLQGIGASIPRALLRKAMRTTSEANFERNLVEQMMRDPRATLDDKRRLRKALCIIDDPRYNANSIGRTGKTEVDPRVAKEIERFVGARVRRDIRAGRLPDPKKDKDAARFHERVQATFR